MKPIAVAILLAISLPAIVSGQAPPGGDDPLARYLFPPDRVMGRAAEIGLDEAQKNSIRNEVQKAQPRFIDLQFELQGEMEKLTRLLQEKTVEEAKVLSQLDRILALEKEIKKTQISLLVRIKNLLTPSQQAKLAEAPRAGGR